MAIFDQLPRASFSGAEFPVENVRVKGGIRYHVHEYAHVPGGDLEKLGRRLYEIEMRATFQSTGQGGDSFGGWGPIWPGRLALLRSLFEAQTTATLVIPTVGGIKACCVDWDQEMVAKMRSGEGAVFKFLEDQESAFAFQNLISVKTKSLPALADNAQREFEKAGIDASFTDQLAGAVNAVLAIGDQADLFGQNLAAKLGLISALCQEFNKRIPQFQSPRNFPALDALKDLWLAAQQLAANTDGAALTFAFFETRVQMTISQVATVIYGSTERATELLQLNPIEDAFNIPPGTRVRYAVPVDQQQAA